MTEPRRALCRCGHEWLVHPSQHSGMCTAPACSCTDYRPAVGQFARPATQVPAALRSASPRAATIRPEAQPVARSVPPEPSDRDVFSGQRGPTIEQILHAGKRSASKRTVALTEKIAVQINDLRGRLHDEREASEEARKAEAVRAGAKAKIAELERQLLEARAVLRGGTTTAAPSQSRPRAASGEHQCPDCDRTFDTPQGVGPHRRKAHGYSATTATETA